MKPKGAHPDKVLTAVKVRNLAKPGRYADGNGLYLFIDDSGSRRWVLRTVVHGRRRDIGLGGVRLVSLAEARELAVQYRKVAREGGDPLSMRRKARQVIPTFEKAARIVHAENRPTWRNKKHVAQWINTLSEYAFPAIGNRPVDQIDAPDVLKVLSPIWLAKPETARRVRQRVSAVLDWAKAAGHRSGDNPVEGISKGLPKQSERASHHAAMPYAEVPKFIPQLRACDSGEGVRLAFEFLILTASRTGEVIGARWSEMDLVGKTWIVPAARMKGGRNHRVPLVAETLAILERVQQLAPGGDYVFAGRSKDETLSNMAFLMTLRRMNVLVTAHGFRSAFRDWASECTNFTNDVCELALAHSIKSKVEAAYRRGDQLEKRRALMASWAHFAASSTANIIPLRA